MSRYPWPDFANGIPINVPDEDGWILVVPATEETPHSIRVKVDELPDGRPIITGLMIDPEHDEDCDYGGYLRDQEITPAMLADFPVRSMITAAISTGILLVGGRGNLIHGSRALHEEMTKAKRDDEWSEIERHGGERDQRIMKAVRAYEAAVRQGSASPRKDTEEATGFGVRSVDEYLRDARKRGWLAPYEGPQARHGVIPDVVTTEQGSEKAPRRNKKGRK